MKTKIPQEEEDNLYPAEDGEASKKAHGASDQAQLGLYCHLQTILKSALCINWKVENQKRRSFTFWSFSISS